MILQSDVTHKLIVAGPGTGKTHTFKELLIRNPGDNLVMTFINNLVRDMAKDVGGLADVRTFHSYCRKLLHKLPVEGIGNDFIFFPKLKELIALDEALLAPYLHNSFESALEAFDDAFRNLNEHDERIEFFISRADFYNGVGFDDSVFRVLTFFRRNPEAVPSHTLLILDEYQDFNALEVAFISILEQRSPTLIVGDDDQAIYDFRSAKPLHLRTKAQDPKYTRFPLPYCSRCTDAVISATHSVISHAQGIGLLRDRLEKKLICYSPDKAPDNAAYPAIITARCSTHSKKKAPYIPMYIEHVIRRIPAHEVASSIERDYPLALVVAPSHYLVQIYEYLHLQFPNVKYTPRSDFELSPIDAYYCLLANPHSNLGWRLLLQFDAPSMVAETITSVSEERVALVDLLDSSFCDPHLQRRARLAQAIRKPNETTTAIVRDLEDYFELSYEEIIAHLTASTRLDGRNDDQEDHEELPPPEPQPEIRLTTYSGCKGLSAYFTFVAGLEAGVFPGHAGRPTETEVCQLIVAITRTRKQCHLVTTGWFAGNRQQPSEFLNWLPPAAVQHIEVTKEFFY